MYYMVKVGILVSTLVFGFTGVFILGLFAWTEAKRYAQALQAMQRVAAPARRDVFAISRTGSRNHNGESASAA